MAKVRAHAFVEGRVQGVFFRDSTRAVARALDVCGWVRNCLDGRVEVLFEGEERQVKKALEFVHAGPDHAYVSEVQVDYEDYSGEFDSFDIVG